jgi:hypothetical protein
MQSFNLLKTLIPLPLFKQLWEIDFVETSGTFDYDAELKIWISSEAQPSIKKQFNKSVNVYEVQKVLAHHILK